MSVPETPTFLELPWTPSTRTVASVKTVPPEYHNMEFMWVVGPDDSQVLYHPGHSSTPTGRTWPDNLAQVIPSQLWDDDTQPNEPIFEATSATVTGQQTGVFDTISFNYETYTYTNAPVFKYVGEEDYSLSKGFGYTAVLSPNTYWIIGHRFEGNNRSAIVLLPCNVQSELIPSGSTSEFNPTIKIKTVTFYDIMPGGDHDIILYDGQDVFSPAATWKQSYESQYNYVITIPQKSHGSTVNLRVALKNIYGEGNKSDNISLTFTYPGRTVPDATGTRLFQVAPGADMLNANFTDRDLSNADLSGAKFTNATLTRTNFTDSSLNFANFTDSSLNNADFSGADLTNATLTRANLTKTNFTNANLAGVISSGIANFSEVTLPTGYSISSGEITVNNASSILTKYTDHAKKKTVRKNILKMKLRKITPTQKLNMNVSDLDYTNEEKYRLFNNKTTIDVLKGRPAATDFKTDIASSADSFTFEYDKETGLLCELEKNEQVKIVIYTGLFGQTIAFKKKSNNKYQFGVYAGSDYDLADIKVKPLTTDEQTFSESDYDGRLCAPDMELDEGDSVTTNDVKFTIGSIASGGVGPGTTTVDESNVSATTLKNLLTQTADTIDVNAVNTISGTVADLKEVYNSGSRFTGLGNEVLTILDTNNVSAADLITLNGNTTGNIDANNVTSITGTIAALNTAYAAGSASGNGISNLGNEAVTVSDDGTITDVTSLTTLNGYTTGSVNADAVAGFRGTISDLNAMYAGAVSSGNGITNIGDKVVTITDTSVADASTLLTLNGHTSGVITANSVTALTGTAAVLNTVLTAGNNTIQFSANSFSNLATATVSDNTINITDLNESITQANIATGGSNTIFTIPSGATITAGDEAAFSTLLTYETNYNISISNQNLTVSGTVSQSNKDRLDATTTGTVTATVTGNTDAGNTDAGNTDAGNTDAGNADAASVVGDPYVCSLKTGEVWKMPNFEGYSRMLQGTIDNQQLTINVKTTFNTDEEIKETVDYVMMWSQNMNVDYATLLRTHRVAAKRESFMRELWVQYGEKEMRINMEQLIASNNAFSVSQTDKQAFMVDYDCHDSNNLRIDLTDDLHIIISKFDNPQVKTGFSLKGNTSQIKNTSGALCNKLYKEDMILEEITSIEPIQQLEDRAPKGNSNEIYYNTEGNKVSKSIPYF